MVTECVARLGDLAAMRTGDAGMNVPQMGGLNVAGHVTFEAAGLAAIPTAPHCAQQ